MIVRLRIILFSFLLVFLLIIIRLFYWQVIRAGALQEIASAQYGKLVEIVPERGEIRTSDGFPIASNKISYTVFANPKIVENKSLVSKEISEILEIDRASISAQLDMDKFWVPLARNVASDKKEEIEKMSLTGIGFEKNFTRFYPEASMAAHLVGILGKDDNGRDTGYFGLEGFYDKLLRGKEGKATLVEDATGKPILSEVTDDSAIQKGSSLNLTIDRSIQYIADQKIKEAVERYGAESGMVGIINPKTGEILAISSVPSFDPSKFWEFDEKSFVNPFISSLYEPGSTFKPLVMSSAFESKVVEPSTKCNICGEPVEVGGYSLHTWNDKYYENTTMTDVIIHSDNTGMVFVAQKLGLDKMISFLSKFGFGEITGIDLQGEVSGDLKPRENWYAVDLATAAFGQGISVTPIQLLQAFQAIANKGRIMQAHVVGSIETEDGKMVKVPPKELGRPISEKTAKVMTEILVDAVDEGEAKWTSLKDYRIAGKTGTASIPVAGHYDPTKTIASFIGFAPADDPKFLMLVIINKPTTSIYGAETAAPVFFDISKSILSYYGIPPSE